MSDRPSPHQSDIEWDSQGQPVSTHFDDVYFSKDNGLAETEYVFLVHNQLAQRFQNLGAQHFTIAETGFGTGLNFLAAWRLWKNGKTTSPSTSTEQHLHFISVEKYPLAKQDLQRALSLWPELHYFSEQLIEQYPETITGFHRLFFSDNVSLTLIFDDAIHGFHSLLGCLHPISNAPQWSGVDAWFLDGFAPAKNPDMWSETLFNTMAALSKPTTTLATFTAAGIVKNGLRNAGFTIQKTKGYGRKRDMVIGQYAPENLPQDHTSDGESKPSPSPNTTHSKSSGVKYDNAPWMLIDNLQATPLSETIAVIGGGIAGCHIAYALAQKGYKVKLFEQHQALAQGASGNTQGVVYAKLSASNEPQGEFNLFSLLFAQRFYQAFWKAHPHDGQQCGVLQLSLNDSQKQQHQQIAQRLANNSNDSNHSHNVLSYLEPSEASTLANTTIPYPCLFFPKAGWLNPATLCHWLCNHTNIDLIYNKHIKSIERENSQWKLQYADDYEQFHTVVITNANDAKQFTQTSHLPTKKIRGQVTHYPDKATSTELKTVVCGKGYIAPSYHHTHCLGASFNLGSDNLDLTRDDHANNLAHIRQQAPKLLSDIEEQLESPENLDTLGGKVGFRCTTPDYLPIVGAVPIEVAMQERFKKLKHDAKHHFDEQGEYYPNLYVSLGYGSRGLAYSPLCSEYLASLINGSPPPLPMDLSHRLNPARFIIRDLIRSNDGKR